MTHGQPRPDAPGPHDVPPAAAGQGARVRPFGALHTVGAVQQRAIDDAERVIGRFLGPGGGAASRPAASGTDAPVPEAALIRRAAEAWLGVVEVAFGVLDLPGATDDRGEALVLVAGAGGTAEGRVWLHNTLGEPSARARVRATALCAHDGGVIGADRVAVEPATLASVPAGGAAEARVRVDAAGAAPGRYHGHLLTGASALAVQVDVVG